MKKARDRRSASSSSGVSAPGVHTGLDSRGRARSTTAHEENASLILADLVWVRMLEYGLTGEVHEFLQSGKSVAVKVGFPLDHRWHEEEGFEDVENEIEGYDASKNLQERVVPRVVAGGFDKHFLLSL